MMNSRTRRLLAIALALIVVLLAGATATFAANGSPSNFFGTMMGGSGSGGMMGGQGQGGMMNGSGYNGMMNGQGSGGMMSGGSMSGMMGSLTGPAAGAKTITIEQAQQSLQQFIDRRGNANLAIDEVIEFQRNFYAIVKDTSTGHGAFEVLINKVTGAVFLEHGPAMMWNTQYGMMRGAMSGMMGFRQATGPMTVSADQARQIAQKWLDNHRSGTVAEAPDQFPGYYTVHFRKDGAIAGMLSVNGYSGRVWYHNWHGKFIRAIGG